MLTIYVLDQSADARNNTVEKINRLLETEPDEQLLLPRISIRPITKQELKFNAAPDILVVGPELATLELSEIANIKKILPSAAILVKLNDSLNNLTIIEQIARLGADDIFSDNTTASELLRKIILLARKRTGAKHGRLIAIESGKGGIGATTITAALGEVIASTGKKVALVDLDFDTQDLSRFLQVRPFVNENLQLLLDQQRPISEDSVRQCLSRVWENEENLVCMTPIPDSDGAYDPRSLYSRGLLSVLEVLDGIFDYILVDMGGARGAIERTIHRVADRIVFLISNDPACVYASVDKISRLRTVLSAGSEILLVENARQKHALPPEVLRAEIQRVTKLGANCWQEQAIPFCSRACHWPGSGASLAASGNREIASAIQALAANLGVEDFQEKQKSGQRSSIVSGLRNLINRARGTSEILENFPIEKRLEAEPRRVELPAPEDLVGKPRITEDEVTSAESHSASESYFDNSEYLRKRAS